MFFQKILVPTKTTFVRLLFLELRQENENLKKTFFLKVFVSKLINSLFGGVKNKKKCFFCFSFLNNRGTNGFFSRYFLKRYRISIGQLILFILYSYNFVQPYKFVHYLMTSITKQHSNARARKLFNFVTQ